MICRNRKIVPTAAEIMLSISFTAADVKAWLATYLQRLTCNGDAMLTENVRNLKMTEPDTRYWIEHAEMFDLVEQPWRSDVSAWWWCQLIHLGYLRESASESGSWYVTERAMRLVRVSKISMEE